MAWRKAILYAVVATCVVRAQLPVASDEPVPVGNGVSTPHLLRKVEPEYSPEARSNRIQGTVILALVVNQKGRASDISIVSPLGFGLDERAIAAVEKWEFSPGMKDGKPVKVLATIEVNFRFPELRFDETTEKQRTTFNVALRTLNSPNSKPEAMDRAVRSMLDLSRHRFAPAIYLVGMWNMRGEHGLSDAAAGMTLLQQAAAKNYADAIYEVAIRRIEGRGVSQDEPKGLQEMRDAATLGNFQAQYYLGRRYKSGDGVPLDLDRARRYYHLCAAQNIAACQYGLARLLFDAPNRRERDYLQALALFQLAADQGFEQAKGAAAESEKLTADQARWVASLKRQIVRK